MRQLFNFCTVSRTSLLLILVFVSALECSIIQKHQQQHKAKLVRVLRASDIQKTRLADGTKFESFVEKGEIPALPIEEEEEAEDLNDPRIGHIDKDGGIAVPVDANGNVLRGYEYLLQPITIDMDSIEKDVKSRPSGDSYNLPEGSSDKQKDYKPYPNNQDMSPKQEFLPGEQETGGDEYDDVASEPREPLPNVPDLPKLDYSDSGEDDEDLKAGGGDVGEDEGSEDEKPAPRPVEEVIYPIRNIEIPISQDDVDEASKTMDEVEQETEIRRDEESGGRGVDIPLKPEQEVGDDSEGRGVDIPKNELPDESETNAESEDISSEELTEQDLEELAKDLGKEVYGNVMNKAKELGWNNEESDSESVSEFESESEASDIDSMDPNSISAQAEIPSDSEGERVVDALDNDGVVLPEQEELTEEELMRIEAESLKPKEPVAPAVPPHPKVRGGRIGSGVQPDSATQHNILIQFLIVSLVFLIL